LNPAALEKKCIYSAYIVIPDLMNVARSKNVGEKNKKKGISHTECYAPKVTKD